MSRVGGETNKLRQTNSSNLGNITRISNVKINNFVIDKEITLSHEESENPPKI